MNKLSEIELIPYCIKCLEKERRLRFVTFTLVLCIGLSLLYFFWENNRGLVIVGMILSVTGLKFLFDTIRSGRPKYDTIIKTLSFHAESIVWVYALKIDTMPFGIQLISNGRLALKLSDGKELSLSINSSDIPNILDILKVKLPHATFGYTDEKKQMYLMDPYLLYKESKS